MSVKMTDRTAQIVPGIQAKASLALRFILEDIDKTSIPNTPKLTGDLRIRKRKQVLGLHAKIGWLTEYALKQELTQFRHYTTPGTGPHFAEDAVRAVVSRAEQHFRKAGL